MRNPGREAPVSSSDERSAASMAGVSVEQLLETLRPELLRFAYWLCRNRAVAEDVVQEALLRAWRYRGDLKDLAAARPWLLTIVRREHARLYERKRLDMTPLDEIGEREDGRLATSGDGDLQELRTAILELPDKYREPLVMQVLGGFTTDEIGQELGLTQTAVLTRLFRARNALRTAYGLSAAPDDADENEGATP